jgi:hypothetical protein
MSTYLGALGLEKDEYIDERGDFEIKPAGDYKVQIVKSSVDRNKKDIGNVLTLELEIIDGDFKGQKLFDRLNIEHENSTTEKIGRGQLRKIVEILELPLSLNDSEKLHYKPLVVSVKIEKRKDNGEDANVVSYYKSINAPTKEAPVAKEAASEAPKSPWKKKM